MPPKAKAEKPPVPNGRLILTINSGSFSVKFSLYRLGSSEDLVLQGQLDRIGVPSGLLPKRLMWFRLPVLAWLWLNLGI